MNPQFDHSSPPLVSVLILYWNNPTNLSHCLNCLKQQTFTDFEVVVMDNGSEKDHDFRVKNNEGGLNLQVKQLKKNTGYAFANNLGAHIASGKWLALLNADAFPQPDWLEQLLNIAERKNDYAVFTSRQLQASNPALLDGAGDAYHISGLAWRRHYNKSVQEHGNQILDVFSACPAAALYVRDDFLQVGGFDEDYFSYFEDVDLGFRLRLAGKKCLYVPDAVVRHVGSASTGKRSNFSVYYGYRNMIWTFFKDMPFPLIWLFLPIHIITVLFFFIHLTMRGQGIIILKAIVDAILGLPKVIEKRRAIQRNNKIKSSELLKVMSKGFIEPYHEFVQRNNRPLA